MKKLVFTGLALSLFFSAAQAQSLYVRGSIGFAFANAGQTLDDGGSPHNGSMNYVLARGATVLGSFQLKRVSFNTGIQGSVAIGHMLNNNVGLELGADVGIAHIEQQGDLSFPDSDTNYRRTVFYSQYAKNPVILTPALFLQSGGKKVNIYTRVGLALPLKTKLTTEVGDIRTAVGTTISRSVNYEYDLKTSYRMGFSGAAGIKYTISPKLQMAMEVSGISLSVYAKERTITSYSQNGVDMFSQLPDAFRRVSFGTSGGSNILPTYSVPFSNVALRAGVFYTLR